MSLNTVEPTQLSYQIPPVMQTMLTANDQRPKTGLPAETEGTVQQNAKPLPEVTLYNANGIVNKTKPNALIAYA